MRYEKCMKFYIVQNVFTFVFIKYVCINITNYTFNFMFKRVKSVFKRRCCMIANETTLYTRPNDIDITFGYHTSFNNK